MKVGRTRSANALIILLVAASLNWPLAPRAAPPPGLVAQDLPSLVARAELVLVGTVIVVKSGRAAGEGHARLQFEDITVRVEKSLKGVAGADVIVESVAIPPGTQMPELGPPYRAGERYILFLSPGEGRRYVSLPQGRYRVETGRIRATQPGPVAEKVDGREEMAFVREIVEIVARGR